MFRIAQYLHHVVGCQESEIEDVLRAFASDKLNGHSKSSPEQIEQDICAIVRDMRRHPVGKDPDTSEADIALIAAALTHTRPTLQALLCFDGVYRERFYVSQTRLAWWAGLSERDNAQAPQDAAGDGLRGGR